MIWVSRLITLLQILHVPWIDADKALFKSSLVCVNVSRAGQLHMHPPMYAME